MALRGKPKKLKADALWEYALRALGQRAHSANEIKRKLEYRAETPADLTEVLAKLRDYGMTDDLKYSETFATSRIQNSGFGRYRVLRDLQAKRVAGSVAKEAVEKAYAGSDEHEMIESYLARKYRGKNLTELLQQDKNLAGAYRKLRLAGFSSQASIDVLKRHAAKAAEIDPSDEEPSL